MGVPSLLGFEWRDADREKITMIVGTAQYITSVASLPPDSASLVCFGGPSKQWRYDWLTDTGVAIEPTTEEYWIFFQYYTANNHATRNDDVFLGSGRAGTKLIGVSFENNTLNVGIRLGAGAALKAAGATAVSIGEWNRYALHVEGHAEGDTISVYLEGNLSTAVATYTLTAADETELDAIGKATGFHCIHKTSGTNERIDDVFWMDPNDGIFPTDPQELISASIKGDLPTGDGTDTDWTGDWDDINEAPPGDVTVITADAVDEASTFTFDAIDGSYGRAFAVKMSGRVLRTGTDAGANLDMRRRLGATVNDGNTVAAPGDGEVSVCMMTDPDGNPWTTANVDATELGFVART